MPSRLEYWQCKLCGAQFDLEDHAKSCERSHIPIEQLHILESKAEHQGIFKYGTQNKLPTTISIGNKEGVTGTYILHVAGRYQGNAMRRRILQLEGDSES